ncbi:hypothetical protein Pfo_022468 [Paulownia fortunei]|nr:hypothetical protein Pfo_022468 [Paulownia fortunei]
MVRKDMEFVGLEKLVDLDACHDLIHARGESINFDNKLYEYETLLEENNEVDVDYKNFLLYILTKEERVKSLTKRREKDDVVYEHNNDCYAEEKNGRQYELFLKKLTAHEKSYVLEDEKNGLHMIIKYEGDASSGKECDPEPRRKLRSAMKQKNGPSNQMSGVENQKYGGHGVVYELNDGENNCEREEHNDACSFDVEILDNTSFYKEGNLNTSMAASTDVLRDMNKDSILNLGGPSMQFEFRHQVITVLRKPYDKEKYDKLLLDIGLRKPEECHMELCHGKDRSCLTNKVGKSYLDHHPGLLKILRFLYHIAISGYL